MHRALGLRGELRALHAAVDAAAVAADAEGAGLLEEHPAPLVAEGVGEGDVRHQALAEEALFPREGTVDEK